MVGKKKEGERKGEACKTIRAGEPAEALSKILSNSPGMPFTHASAVLTVCSYRRVFGLALRLALFTPLDGYICMMGTVKVC